MCLKRERVEDLDCLSEVNGPARCRSVFVSPWHGVPDKAVDLFIPHIMAEHQQGVGNARGQ